MKADDDLWLSFAGDFTPTDGERGLTPLLQSLERYAGEWMPDIVTGKRRRKYTRAAVWKALEESQDGGSVHIELARTQAPALDVLLTIFSPPLKPEVRVSMELRPLSFFTEETRCHALVEMVREWAMHYPVVKALAGSIADAGLVDVPPRNSNSQAAEDDGVGPIHEVSWLNVFSAKLVEKVGRERVLSTPAHRVEALPDGAVLVQLGPVVTDFAREDAREVQARALVHLRPDLDLDTVRRTLHERSARLAPVVPRFAPDVAPLLERVVARTSLSERQVQIARYNAWVPPEPEEWLPVALPADVEDVARAIDGYDDLAEGLVALLHTQVPSVFDATPASLTDVDEQFWVEYFPGMFPQERIDARAVPAIGAYLGQVLVRHLGGEWIPRRNLQEAQVRVGQRVWLPFLRAWRYMRQRESVLDYSLTQFFRAASRHRS
ncbi:hypothetical protein [Archangium primigenium]|uniref:hypothetical protein n=1 Tax=[Archangium] primigenium TaxID=2792470 RepID=UPI001EF87F93|nr:hypothetical protein [Archangium primigenium]